MSSEEGCGGARAKRCRDHGPPNRWSSWQQENHFAHPMWPRVPSSSLGPRAPGLMPHPHQVLMEHRPFGTAYGRCNFNGSRPRFPYNSNLHVRHYNQSGLYSPQGHQGVYDYRPNGDWNRNGNQAVYGKKREQGAPHRANQELWQGSSHQNGRRNSRSGWKNSRKHPKPLEASERRLCVEPDEGGNAVDVSPHEKSSAEEAKKRLEAEKGMGRVNDRPEDCDRRPSARVHEDQEEGAVGGVEADVPREPDKNWVDEGAICDLDRMFQNQENSLLGANYNKVGISASQNIGLRPPTQSSCVVSFSDEEDSDLENCDNVSSSIPNGALSSPEKAQFVSSHPVPGGRFCLPSPPQPLRHKAENPQDPQALDDAEDTGDFIDTDLPSHNKHLLSSSDEDKDSLSSHSPSEEDELDVQTDSVLLYSNSSSSIGRGQEQHSDSLTGSTSMHNDLSSSVAVLQGDFDNISLVSGQPQACSLPSHGKEGKDHIDQPGIGRGDSDSSSFSESENGDPPLASRSRSCVEGAAASQLSPLDKPPEAPPRAVPPCLGASWELPPLPQPGVGPQTASSGFEWEHTAEAQGAGTCWEVPRAVNDLNLGCHPQPGLMVMANGLSHQAPSCGANFSNDEINRHQKVFMKFPMGRGSHSASASANTQEYDNVHVPVKKHETNYAKGGSEDPLRPGCEERVELVFLPMEDEADPPHPMSGAGAEEHLYMDTREHSHLSLGEHVFQIWPQEPSSLVQGDTAEPLKSFSDTDNYIRLLDQTKSRQSPAVEQLSPPISQSPVLGLDHAMIWSEDEAFVMQYKQIATSACGPTALLNVMKALKLSCDKTVVSQTVQSSLRKESACIPEYLFSRACAGTTAEDLLVGVEKLSGGAVGGRFFHFWPPRQVKLLHWLAHWIRQGAVPIATLNLQKGPYSVMQVPDSWHHQMVYGVCPQGVHLTNPLEIVSARSTLRQLCSDSVLMVRRQDVVSRFRQSTDLRELLKHPDPRWRTMNVLGQVVNVLRECHLPSVPGYRLQVTSHVTIPAAYKSGITLFMRKDNPSWDTLLSTPDLATDVASS